MPGFLTADNEHARRAPAREALPAAPVKVAPAAGRPLAVLQAAAGNRAVARMVERGHSPALASTGAAALQRAPEEDELQMKHDATLQREGDEEEELQMKHDPALQRSGPEEEELQMKHDPAPRVGLEGGPVGPEITSAIESARGSGSGLESGFRERMEQSFGADLSSVRVHQDAASDTLNRQLTARAFTTGSDIFLRGDASPSDHHLMAHELTHVIQQRSGAGGSGEMTAGPANDPQEAEADRTAEAVLAGNGNLEQEEARA